MYPNYYQFQQGFQSQGSQLVRVTGIDGAKAYQMTANSTVALFDSGSDVMYIKSTDGAGFPTIRTFKFEEVVDIGKENIADYVTREEFDSFKQEMKEYGKQSISKPKSTKQGADVE